MRLAELDQILIDALAKADHPEIVSVRTGDTAAVPLTHTRLWVDFASGANAYVMVRQVTGPNIPRHADYELPREVG